MVIIELSTLKEGKVIMFISVDNFSRYCFSHAVKSPLTFKELTEHLDVMLVNLRQHHPGIVPTFIMGYGESMQFDLSCYYKKRANFIFSVTQANKIAQPVAEDLLKHLVKEPRNN